MMRADTATFEIVKNSLYAVAEEVKVVAAERPPGGNAKPMHRRSGTHPRENHGLDPLAGANPVRTGSGSEVHSEASRSPADSTRLLLPRAMQAAWNGRAIPSPRQTLEVGDDKPAGRDSESPSDPQLRICRLSSGCAGAPRRRFPSSPSRIRRRCPRFLPCPSPPRAGPR